MSTYWSTLPKCTFNGVPFPVESSRIEGGMRDHVHEYPHTPGGSPELLGRSLYTFHVTAKFDVRFASDGSYPGLYPGDLNTLLDTFEQGQTWPLRLSQMETAVPAYAVKWTREQSAKVLSGETVQITFRENQSSLFLFGNLVATAPNIATTGQVLSSSLQSVQAQLSTTTMNLFAQLTQAISSVVSWEQQTVGQFTSQYYSALQFVQTLCGNIDQAPDILLPGVWPVITALHDVWFAAISASQPQQQTGVSLQQWVNPTVQDIGQISIAIYDGDSSQVGALLSLNVIQNPMAVPAGMSINFYPAQ